MSGDEIKKDQADEPRITIPHEWFFEIKHRLHEDPRTFFTVITEDHGPIKVFCEGPTNKWWLGKGKTK